MPRQVLLPLADPDAEQHGITELQRNRHRQRYVINQKQRYDGGHASQYHPSAGLFHPIRPLRFRDIPEAQDTVNALFCRSLNN